MIEFSSTAASPSFARSQFRPRHPADLTEHVFVTVPPSMHKPVVTFRKDAEDLAIPIRYEITSNNPVLNRDVVLEGIGVGLLPLLLIAEEIEEGRLIRLLEEYEIVDTAAEVRLAYNTRTLSPAKVRAFIAHATDYFEVSTKQLGLDGTLLRFTAAAKCEALRSRGIA